LGPAFAFIAIFLSMLAPPLIGAMLADLTRLQVILLSAVGSLIAGYFVVTNMESFQTAYWRWTMPATPAAERQFIAAAEAMHALRLQAVTDAGDRAALRQAEAKLCALPTDVSGWTGRLEQKYLDDAGQHEMLAVAIWPHLMVRTALFPDATRTMIRAGTPIFTQTETLAPGASVRFNGRIVGHAGACPGDPPTDPNEKLRDPELLFWFTQLEKLPG